MLNKKEIKVLELINSDIPYFNYFFKNVKDEKWFYTLKKEGYFNSENALSPVEVKGGYQIPFWMPLLYFEQISLQVKEGKHPEYIPELLEIIKNVSERHKQQRDIDNYRTWWFFIKILSNIPNEKIPAEILDYIPVWFDSRFDSTLTSSDLVTKLLPKFLPDNPSKNDIKKFEIIIKYILTPKAVKQPENGIKVAGTPVIKYTSHIKLYWINNELKQGLIENFARYCSVNLIYELADNLKFLLRAERSGIETNCPIDGKTYTIEIKLISLNDIILSVFDINNNNTKEKLFDIEIKNIDTLSKNDLIELIKNSIIQNRIDINKSSGLINTISDFLEAINIDYSTIWAPSIRKYQAKHIENLKESITIILRDILKHFSKFKSAHTNNVIKDFLSEKYPNPLFKRFALYLIGENWNEYKNHFWKITNPEKGVGYLNISHYDKEIYELLNMNIQYFTKKEKEVLHNIINDGPILKNREISQEYLKHWKLKWYSALKDDKLFENEYNELSKELNLTDENFESLGEIKVNKGEHSPLSVEDLLKMSNDEIVKKIKTFDPNQWIDNVSIGGLAKMIGQAIEHKPEKFTNEIELYINVPYIYAYHIINSFRDAWKNKKEFSWGKIFLFIKKYISQKEFGTDKLELQNDSWRASANWVKGSVGNLIQEGLRADGWAFDKKYMAQAKEIIFILISTIEVLDDIEETNMDYTTYTFNSTAGKLMMALLEYALRNARLKYEKPVMGEVKWEDDIIEIYEKCLERRIIDAYILKGFYFSQFLYLDKNWLIDKVKKNIDIEDKYRIAFIEGYLFNNPVNSREIYKIMLPHYLKYLEKNISIESPTGSNIIRHIAIFYFWEFETIGKDNIITKFIKESPPKLINELIHFIWTQRDYAEKLKKEESEKFIISINKLWKCIFDRFKNEKDEDSIKAISNLSKFAVFVSEIEEDSFQLLIKTAEVIEYDFNSTYLIEELDRLKNIGNSIKTGQYIGKLYLKMLENSTPDYNKDHIISIISHLYKIQDLEIKGLADYICNEYGKRGIDFLKELFFKNN